MEVCQLECEHRKGTVFGVDLAVLLRDRPLAVPFVVAHCTAEIERRALSVEVRPGAAGTRRTLRPLVWSDLSLFLSLALALTGRVPHQRVQTSHPEAVPGLGEPEGAGGPLRTLPARHHLHPEAVLQGGTVCLIM